MFMYKEDPHRWMFNHRRVGKQLKFSLLPRKCYLSGKSLWLKPAIIITSMVTGPGDPVIENYWCLPEAFLFYELKRV